MAGRVRKLNGVPQRNMHGVRQLDGAGAGLGGRLLLLRPALAHLLWHISQ